VTDHAAENSIEPVYHHIRHGWSLDRGNALRAVGKIEGLVEIVGQDPDDLTETEGDDGQIIPAQPEYRQAEDDPGHTGNDDADQNKHVKGVSGQEERQIRRLCSRCKMEDIKLLRAEKSPQIGTHGIKCHVAEIEQAGKTDHDIEAQGQGRKDGYLKNDFQVKDISDPDDRYDHQGENHSGNQLEPATGPKEVQR